MNSKPENIISQWFYWQYYEMPKFLLQVWNNYFNFATEIFSLPLLLKTFFSPWRKYNWRYPKRFDIVEFFNTFISNIFSRIMGAAVRIGLIILGILFQIFVAAAGLVIFSGWILMPIIIFFGLLFVLLF